MEEEDRISQLPQDVLHHILSFLSLKEVVLTGTLSKRWQHTWNTCQVLEFDTAFMCTSFCPFFYGCGMKQPRILRRKTNGRFRFIRRALLERRRQMVILKKFTLDMTHCQHRKLRSALDRWLGYAVEVQVQHLQLATTDYYILPGVVLGARSIVQLELNHCTLEGSHYNFCDIKFPSLKRLSLIHFRVDNDTVLHLIINESPLVEDLSLFFCQGFNTLHITKDLVKLAKVRVQFDHYVDRLKIEAPNLCTLSLEGPDLPGEVDLAVCEALKHFRVALLPITDKWFRMQLSKFPSLETLSFASCDMMENVKISSGHLQNLRVGECMKLAKIEIESPCLLSLVYTGNVIAFSSSSRLPLREVVLNLATQDQIDTSFYVALIEILAKFNTCSRVHLRSKAFESYIIPAEELRQTLTPPLHNIKDLTLTIYSRPTKDFGFAELLDAVLWMCPHLRSLSMECDYGRTRKLFFQFLYGNLDYEGNSPACCKSFPVSCWDPCISAIKVEELHTKQRNRAGYPRKSKHYHFDNCIWKNLIVLDEYDA